jgi:surface polysaccharide O-acyltransferase-like enzyme
MVKKRLLWADVLRIAAIYLVLVKHTSNEPTKFSPDQIGVFISIALATSCVPLFVMLSGALLLNTKDENYKTFFSKRLARAIIPWIAWTLIYSLIHFYSGHDQSLLTLVRIFRETLFSFWFLPLITGLYLITPATRIFVQSARPRDIAFIISLWFLTVSLLPHLRNTLAFPLRVDDSLLRQVVSYFGYFLMGYLFVSLKQKKHGIFFPLILLITGLVVALFYRSSGFTEGFITPGIVIITAALFNLVYISFTNLDHKLNTSIRSVITTISQAVFGIYFIHTLLVYAFRNASDSFYIINLYKPLDNFINGILLFFASFIIIFILRQIPFLKKIIS